MTKKEPHYSYSTEVEEVCRRATELHEAARDADACDLLYGFLAAQPVLTPEEELRVKAHLAMDERGRGRFSVARELHRGAAHLADVSRDAHLNAKYHNGYAVTLQHFGERDAARVQFAAASHFYDEAGEHRKRALVENNLAVLELEAGRFEAALNHVATALGTSSDELIVAQVEDTWAMIALARRDPRAALAFSMRSVARLLDFDRPGLLAASVRTLERAAHEFGREAEVERLRAVFESVGWNVTRAAARLGLSREALKQRLRRQFPELDEERRNKIVPSKTAR